MITSVEACLYQPLTIPINFGKLFEQTGTEFTVQLTEGAVLQEQTGKKKKPGKTTRPSLKPSQPVSIATDKLQSRSADSMRLFHTATSSVLLEGDKKGTITLEYIPLKMEARQCCIVLSNASLGDTVILVNASVNLPLPLAPVTNELVPSSHINKETNTLHLKATVDEVIKEEIVVENRNEAFEEVIYQLGKWEIGEEERKRREETKSLWHASLQRAMAAMDLDNSLKTHWDKMVDGSDELHFSVTGDSELFKLPAAVSVPAMKGGRCVLPLEFSCGAEGQFSCRIVLRSPHDVRVYSVEVMVIDRRRTAELEIITPALEPITQKIPIVSIPYTLL